jgi:hypothetical protein
MRHTEELADAAGARTRVPALGYPVPTLLVAALLAAFSAAEASAQPPCVVAAGASTFNLSELSSDAAPLFTGREPYRRNWVYMFSLCGDVSPSAACASAPPAAVLQDTVHQCHSLGASASRLVSAMHNGVAVAFSGGGDGRTALILVECRDVVMPYVASWTEGAPYTALVRARAGCAVECGRDAAGAVCGGEARGTCTAEGNGTNPATCACADGYAGRACGNTVRSRASLMGRLDAVSSSGITNPTLDVIINAFALVAVLLLLMMTVSAAPAPVPSSASTRCPLVFPFLITSAFALAVLDAALSHHNTTQLHDTVTLSKFPCNFICVAVNYEAGLGHRLTNAASSIMLSLASGLPRASQSFESGSGKHGNYLGADDLFFVDVAESRGVGCCDSCGLSVQRLPAPPVDIQNNISALGRWVYETRQPDCGLIIVDEFFLASQESVWSELQTLYHPTSPAALSLKAQVLYSQDKLNIAIHVRVGDITPTPLPYFAQCLQSVFLSLQESSYFGPASVWLFSEESIESVETGLKAVLQGFPNISAELRVDARNAAPLLAFVYLTEADILIASDSSFSWAAAFMSTKPVVIVAPQVSRNSNMRIYLGDRNEHILAHPNGTFATNTEALLQVAETFTARQGYT